MSPISMARRIISGQQQRRLRMPTPARDSGLKDSRPVTQRTGKPGARFMRCPGLAMRVRSRMPLVSLMSRMLSCFRDVLNTGAGAEIYTDIFPDIC